MQYPKRAVYTMLFFSICCRSVDSGQIVHKLSASRNRSGNFLLCCDCMQNKFQLNILWPNEPFFGRINWIWCIDFFLCVLVPLASFICCHLRATEAIECAQLYRKLAAKRALGRSAIRTAFDTRDQPAVAPQNNSARIIRCSDTNEIRNRIRRSFINGLLATFHIHSVNLHCGLGLCADFAVI